MAYPTRAALVALSDVDALTALSAAQQDNLYAAAKRAVESHCGQRFDNFDATRKLAGTSAYRLPLDIRLAEITGLTLNVPFGSSLDVTDVELSEDRDLLYVTPDAQGGGTWATRVLREGRPAVFPAGDGTVSITGTWGWLDVEFPEAVGIAMRLDMEDQALARKHGLAETVRAQSRLGLTSVSEGPLTAQVEVPDVVLSAESQLLLADYIWHPLGFGA